MCAFSEEQRQRIREMDVEFLAKVVFGPLKGKYNPNPHSRGFFYNVGELGKEIFPSGQDNQSDFDYTKILEAIALLERRGLVVKDIPEQLGSFGKNYFSVFLTTIGEKTSIDGEVFLLIDKSAEIVRALEQRVGNLDSVVRQYYLESLRAYQKGLYISSVICLGATSERAIHWLAESIESHFKQYQRKFKAKRNMPDLIKYLSDSVIPNIFSTDKNFADELKKRLSGLGNLYRENRNEAGHPQTVEQSWLREDQEYLLIQFRRYVTTICEAIGRMNLKAIRLLIALCGRELLIRSMRIDVRSGKSL